MADLNSTPSHPDAESYVSLAEAKAYFEDRSGVENWENLDDDKKAAALKIASKHIDSLRFHGCRMFPAPAYYRREQKLQFPREEQYGTKTGGVTSAGAAYIIDTNLANQQTLPDDFFNDGAVVITEGTGKGQTALVSDFEMSTGKITVSANWATTPDTTSRYLVMTRIPDRVKYAVLEQALYILSGGGERQRMQAEGVTSFSLGDLSETYRQGASNRIPLCPEAKGHLRGLYSVIGRLVA